MNFEFDNPTHLIFGAGTLSQLGEVVSKHGKKALIVTGGFGRVQREGGPIEEIGPGDVVWFQPGEKHWHGASRNTAMTHIAIQEELDDSAVDWMEKVSDEQYGTSHNNVKEN